jgi:hypothetical protein
LYICASDFVEVSFDHCFTLHVKDSPNGKDLFSAEILKDKGHLSKIVALQPFGGTEADSDISGNNELSPTQVKLTCTHHIFIVWKSPSNLRNIHV